MRAMEEIAKRRPVNVTAARVTQPGPRGLDIGKRGEVLSPTPLPMRPVPAQIPDMTGQRCGRLTVIGLAVQRAQRGKSRWVCRCVCGYYALRSTKAITNPDNQVHERCERCRQVANLQRETERRRLGLNKPGVEPSVRGTLGSLDQTEGEPRTG
jgi:hypothetical protein